MKAIKFKTIKESFNLDIKAVTLLSLDEVKEVPKNLLYLDKPWWLRSPGHFATKAAFVSSFESVDSLGLHMDASELGVRPALIIENFVNINDEFEIANHNWTAISNNTLLCNDIIGYTIFDDNCNEYKNSIIKQWLEEWAINNNIIKKEC